MTDEADLAMYKFVVDQYQDLIAKTQDYPDWKEKIEEEIGTEVARIHTIQQPNKRVEEVLDFFPKQEFFK